MAWMRLEINYLRHPKFLPLSAAAICLWHEGKSYTEEHLTDGLIPRAALRSFRFHTTGRVAELTRSCGRKPDHHSAYAPLWERVKGFGYKMHDYLEHNDSREVALKRLRASKEEKARKRQNQADWRERKREERNRDRNRLRVTDVTGDESGYETGSTTAATSASPAAPSTFCKNPPTPLASQRGRITRAERKEVERIRNLQMGCHHDPRCETADACIRLMVQERRERRAAS